MPDAARDLPVGYQFGDAGSGISGNGWHGAEPQRGMPWGRELYYGCGRHLATPERELLSPMYCPVCDPRAPAAARERFAPRVLSA